MVFDYIIAASAVPLLLVAWILVQRAWSSAFPSSGADPDTLAGRPGCQGCVDAVACAQAPEEGTGKSQERKP